MISMRFIHVAFYAAMVSAVLLLSSAAIGIGDIVYRTRASAHHNQPRTIYRVCLEGQIKAPASSSLTSEDKQAIDDLRSLGSRWPRMLWIASENGHLWIIKMGTDGKPLSIPAGLNIRKE